MLGIVRKKHEKIQGSRGFKPAPPRQQGRRVDKFFIVELFTKNTKNLTYQMTKFKDTTTANKKQVEYQVPMRIHTSKFSKAWEKCE